MTKRSREEGAQEGNSQDASRGRSTQRKESVFNVADLVEAMESLSLEVLAPPNSPSLRASAMPMPDLQVPDATPLLVESTISASSSAGSLASNSSTISGSGNPEQSRDESPSPTTSPRIFPSNSRTPLGLLDQNRHRRP